MLKILPLCKAISTLYLYFALILFRYSETFEEAMEEPARKIS